MISRKIVESARILKMPSTSQNLYFHLMVNADDDGIVEAYPVLALTKANEDDLRVLISKQFIFLLNTEDLVAFIEDWREQNVLRADRKSDSRYKALLLQLRPDIELLEKKERSDTRKKKEQESLKKAKQYSAQKKALDRQLKEVERKKRTNRLCQVGGAVESVLGKAIEVEDIPKLIEFLNKQESNGGFFSKAMCKSDEESS